MYLGPGTSDLEGQAVASIDPGPRSVTDGERDVDLIMVPDVSIGDYVVVHSGYAIDVIPRDRAVETIRLLGVEEST